MFVSFAAEVGTGALKHIRSWVRAVQLFFRSR